MSDSLYETLKESWNFLEQELDELFVHGSPKTGSNVIAYRQHLWVLPEEIPKETANEISAFLFPKEYNDATPAYTDDASPLINSYDITSLVSDNDRSDILIGNVENGELYLQNSGTFKLDPKSSLLVKKVADALKVKKVTYQDDLEGNSNISVPRKKTNSTSC